ncbi:MAG: BolA/IbaG family iron-sulfur metabolism protein [Pseudomonadota bacterium]|nr:BolA/IbaG family iron-sulfur metabolism protein [Pseudomonadota bacterium]
MTPSQIEELIRAGLPDAAIQVRSGDNVHFEATVVSAAFEGKRQLQRHQMVYRSLGERMGGEIHALQLATLTPTEAGSGG